MYFTFTAVGPTQLATLGNTFFCQVRHKDCKLPVHLIHLFDLNIFATGFLSKAEWNW